MQNSFPKRFKSSSNEGRSNFKPVLHVLKRLLKLFRLALTGTSYHAAYQPQFSYRQILVSTFGSFLGIATLAYLSYHTAYPLIAAPFGATAVLAFAVPDSPLVQPRNVLVGNCIGAIVAILCGQFFGSEPWVVALAVATAIKLMQLTRSLHPPGGAVALVGVMSHATWQFLFAPVLTGSIVIILCTVIFNNLTPGRTYPRHWL